MKILLIDFYDSFTYNLKHYLELKDREVIVIRHDEIGDIDLLSSYSHIILSPGPGMPMDKMNMHDILAFCDGTIPVLGICLGMQAIGLYLGGTLENMAKVMHGVPRTVLVDNSEAVLFRDLPNEFKVGLYHSWCLNNLDVNHVDARLSNGCVMAISDSPRKLFGVQFHPESILSEFGKEILSNFLAHTD